MVVTGADGFIGSHLVRRLQSLDCDVTTVSESETGLPGCRHVGADLTADDAVKNWPWKADHVIHLAARSGGIQSQDQSGLIQANFSMTANTLKLASLAEAPSVFVASSAVVLEPPLDAGVLDENAQLVSPGSRWLSPYAWSKLTSEVQAFLWANRTGGRVVVGRLATVFGPGGSFATATSSVVHALIHRALTTPVNDPLDVWGDGTPKRTFTYVGDAASAIVLLANASDRSMIVNISTTRGVSIGELAMMIAEGTGRDPRMLRFLVDRPSGPSNRELDSTRLQSMGFRPLMTVEDGIRSTIEAARVALNPKAGGM